jgi:hypothetical protein
VRPNEQGDRPPGPSVVISQNLSLLPKKSLDLLHNDCIICNSGATLNEELFMATEPGRKPVKTGVKEGGGPPPGYQWNVDILDQAFDEAKAFLNEDQYDHLANQVRELALEDDPTHSDTVDVRPIDVFYEIRDKGGVLGKINARVFFFVHHGSRTIVVLGAIKKEKEGQTPVGDCCTMRRRRRLYLEKFHPNK